MQNLEYRSFLFFFFSEILQLSLKTPYFQCDLRLLANISNLREYTPQIRIKVNTEMIVGHEIAVPVSGSEPVRIEHAQSLKKNFFKLKNSKGPCCA